MTNFYKQFTDVIVMLIFCLLASGIIWFKYGHYLKNNLKTIFLVTFTGIIYSFISDPVAQRWNAWYFPNGGTFFSRIKILTIPLFEIIFITFVGFTLASAILSFMHRVDKTRPNR